MNIVYIGTPDYACTPLKALIDAGHNITLVVTRPDKPKGRGNKMQKSPVKEFAEQHNIPVIDPPRIKQNPEALEAIKNADPDFIVVFSYGRIIPPEILNAPKYECLNIHASLLPKYRGAAPIQRSVLDGEEETGITLMRMDEGLDTGAMFATARTPIGRKTSAMLFTELSEMGAKLVVDSLPLIASGELKAVEQPDEGSNYAEMIEKEEALIDWSKSAVEIDRMVRAFNDAPIAYTTLNGETLKIYFTDIVSDKSGNPGDVIDVTKKTITVACGEGALNIVRLQAAGKKVMDTNAYLLGNKIEIGTHLG